ncbi:uncharacterized protein K02A2.6-like [Argiope bruennichi]|uniref:uncharacterized protein K02A2.6-like n=1 Tax=Argiope bruennichi TaxID=94029 RepID=UPI00249455E5|nr:uncharacterized protein K02A2.6-like [Argiope bruennichi]
MGRSFEEHLQNVRRILQKLKEANQKLSPSKCHLFRSEVAYLGHIISVEGVRTDPDKISAVRHWTCPTDVHQLRSFLGLCTYYRKFVKNFSTIARPLHKLTEAKLKFIWTDECDNVFNKLKDALTSAPVLACPEIGKQFILDTDASHECIGAVLSQEIDGQERFIAYFKSTGGKPSWQDIVPFHPTMKRYWALWDSLHLRNGVLYRKWESDDGKAFRWQLILPKTRVSTVLKELHGSPTGGHFGPGKHIKGRLQLYNVGAPFERIAFDILGPLPRSLDGNNNILVFMNYFTKWPEAYPIPDQEAPTVAEILVQNCISRYGVTLQLLSDQGRNFDSAVCRRLCEILGIDKTRTTALHPQSDGMEERFNRTILNSLSPGVQQSTGLGQETALFLLVYRSAVHETTSYSPSQMLFGRDLRLPADLLFSQPPDAPLVPEEYVKNLRTRMEEVHHLARDRIGMASEKMKTQYDARATGHNFHEGDQVWLWNPKRRKGLSPKLQTNWEGPYTVLKRLNDVVVRIQKSPHSKPKVIHCNRPAPYLGQGD